MKKTMQISVVVMTVITLVIAVLASRQVFFDIAQKDFENPIVVWMLIAILGIFVIVQTVCLFLYPFQWKKIGFYLLHIGLVAILAGSMIYYLAGIKVSRTYPVTSQSLPGAVKQVNVKTSLLKGENYSANLYSFQFGVTSMDIEYHDPVYDVYTVVRQGDEITYGDYVMKDIDLNTEGVYDFKEYGTKAPEELAKDGAYRPIFLNESQTIVAAPRKPTAKHYLGKVTMVNNETKETINTQIEVNKPLRINGWKIYLMEASDSMAALMFKYDPGEYITGAGLWLVIIGSFVVCLVRPRQKAGDPQ